MGAASMLLTQVGVQHSGLQVEHNNHVARCMLPSSCSARDVDRSTSAAARSAGEVWSAAEGVRWRIINCTLRCTGNDTHALSGASNSRRSSSEMQLALSVLATAVALLAGLYWRMNHGGEARDQPGSWMGWGWCACMQGENMNCAVASIVATMLQQLVQSPLR